MKNTKVLLCYNNKGGVGKTSIVINLAETLGKDFGKKVLCIDNDSQNSLSFLANLPVNENGLFDDLENGHPDLGWLIGSYYISGKLPSYESVQRAIVTPIYHKKFKKEKSMQWEERELPFHFDLLPGYNKDLALTEILFYSANDCYILDPANRPKARSALKLIVDVIRETMDYDYLIIDCAPNLGLNSIQALLAGDELVIPVTPDFLSSAGLSNIIGNLQDLGRFVPNFHILGVVLNAYSGTKSDQLLVEDIEQYGKIMGLNIFENRLPRVNSMKKLSAEDGIAVLSNEKAYRHYNARMRSLAEEILNLEEKIKEEEANG